MSESPVVRRHREVRRGNVQLRVSDAITKFAGTLTFVYVHAVLFVAWMVFVEPNPFPTLTLIVSLEAIFLSTFVMIGQNRSAAFHEAKADHDFREQESEIKRNTELTEQIHQLTVELHARVPERRSRKAT